jgi:outer membrane protein OmpA-like peptidoglycan-associated protein
LKRFGSVFGGVLGVETGGTAATAPAVPVPFGSVVARLTFPPDSAALDPAAARQLETALAVAKAANGALRVVVAPADSPLAEERARAVAQGLERLGAAAGTVETAAGGSGEETLVYLVRRPAA